MRRRAGIAACAVLFAGAVQLAVARDRLPALPHPADADPMWVRSPEAMKRMALSFDALLADVYWIRAIQYYGGTKLSSGEAKTYDRLYPLLDLTTSLDPYFNIAYHFGSIFLSEPYPSGPGRPDLAMQLLQKGLAVQPDHWEFAYQIGMVHYWWYRDYPQAAAWFTRAAAMPGAALWLKPLAGTILVEGGSRAAARQVWQQMLDAADNEWFRTTAVKRLRQLDALDHIDLLNRAAATYEARTGRRLESWQQMMQAGMLRQPPVDPEGQVYALDGERGVITVSLRSPLFPLPGQPPSFRSAPPS